jgi:hypothetical protein
MADVTFIRSRQKLNAFGKEIDVSDFVRTNKDGSITRTEQGIPCKPLPFPAGTGRIFDPLPRDKATRPHLAPWFVPTDFTQMVPEWLLTPGGKYWKPSGRMVFSTAYGIHYSTLDFTWGCIRVIREDELVWFVEKIQAELAELRELDPKQAWVSLEVAA